MERATLALAAVALAAPLGAGDVDRPSVVMRTQPRGALAPASVLVTVELVGGEDLEEFYCPGLLWDWGDGARSLRESDCPPYESGKPIQRRYSARHVYRSSGVHELRFELVRGERTVAATVTTVEVRPRFGD